MVVIIIVFNVMIIYMAIKGCKIIANVTPISVLFPKYTTDFLYTINKNLPNFAQVLTLLCLNSTMHTKCNLNLWFH